MYRARVPLVLEHFTAWIELRLILRDIQGYLKNISCGDIQCIYIPQVFVYEFVVPRYIGRELVMVQVCGCLVGWFVGWVVI